MTIRFAICALLLLLPTVQAQQQTDRHKGRTGKMSPDQVVENVKRKNWAVLEPPSNVGSDAAPALVNLLGDKDSQVRQLTVACLNAAGGPAARQGLLTALKDPTETVRAAAARFLRNHYDSSDLPAITESLNTSSDEYVREQLALLLGESGDTEMVPILAAHTRVENDEHARHAESLAMARLGEPASRMQLVQRLEQNDPHARVGALEDLPYVNDRRLLANVVPLLDDTRPGKNVGPSHGPYFIRVCDVAVNIANEMLGHRFPWVKPVKRYWPEEINQVRMVLLAIH